MINYHNLLNKPRDTGQYSIGGPYTFRRGCRILLDNSPKTDKNCFGGNRQNIESSMRRIWKADDGFKLCQVDQSGADALIVAYLCKDLKYRSLFKNKIKPHHYMGLKLFPDVWRQAFDKEKVNLALNTPIIELKNLPFWGELCKLIASSDKWVSSKRYYYMAKKSIHSFSYGQRENTFRTVLLKETGGALNLSHEDAKAFRLGFFNEFPEILDWHFRLFQEAKKTKLLRNLLGHPYHLTEFLDDNDYKDLIAFVPQSTVAVITLNAVNKWQEYVETNNLNWHFLHETHDSFLCEAPENEILDCANKMKEFIELDLVSPLDGEKFKMKAGTSLGYNWSSWDKDTNPLGLKEI